MIYLLLLLQNEAAEAAPPKHSITLIWMPELSRSHLAAEGLGLEAGGVAGAVVHRRGDGGTSSCRRGGWENKPTNHSKLSNQQHDPVSCRRRKKWQSEKSNGRWGLSSVLNRVQRIVHLFLCSRIIITCPHLVLLHSVLYDWYLDLMTASTLNCRPPRRLTSSHLLLLMFSAFTCMNVWTSRQLDV